MPTPMILKVTNMKEKETSDTIITADTVAIMTTVTTVRNQTRDLGVKGVVEDTISSKDITKMSRKDKIVSILQENLDTCTNHKGRSILNVSLTILRASKATIVNAAMKIATAT